MNKHKPSHKAKAAHHENIFNKLFDGFLHVAQTVHDRRGHITIEWPSNNRYWRRPEVQRLLSIPMAWQDFVAVGCAHGLKVPSGEHAGKFIEK